MIGIGLSSQRRRAARPAWSPALVGGKLLWLRADLGVTLVSGHVSQWDDQSGLGNHVTAQGVSNTRPVPATWSAGLGTTALYYDGNDRQATTGNVLPTADGAGFTTLFVGAFADAGARCPLLTNGTSGGLALSQNVGGTGKLERWKLGVAFDGARDATTAPLNVVMVDQVGATPGSEMYINGALVTTSTPNAGILTPTGKLYLGAAVSGQYHLGYIAEILILSGRASTATIALWNAYTLTRYGV